MSLNKKLFHKAASATDTFEPTKVSLEIVISFYLLSLCFVSFLLDMFVLFYLLFSFQLSLFFQVLVPETFQQ